MYTAKWLNDKEFEALPYPDMEMSLGVADPKTKTAYVRRTGIKDLDFFNTFHELEHLEDGHTGKHADHFENGVYYKKLNEMFQSAAPIAASFIPGVGPFLGPALSATNSFGVFGKSPGQVKQANQANDQQQGAMGQFGMGQTSQPQNIASPNAVQVGGDQGGNSGGGSLGQGTLDKLRQFGFYSGR